MQTFKLSSSTSVTLLYLAPLFLLDERVLCDGGSFVLKVLLSTSDSSSTVEDFAVDNGES